MDFSELQARQRFNVRQKLIFFANRYVVTVAQPDGSEGEVVAFAAQKRLSFKEQVTLYTGESRERVLCTFNARQVLDVGASYDVSDASGSPIGLFRKDFGRSLVRSTWHLEQPGARPLSGRERNPVVAVVRRVWRVILLFIPLVDLPFAWPYHFDFVDSDGGHVMSVTKKLGLRDRYVLAIHCPDVDRRLAIAQVVGLDALQSR